MFFGCEINRTRSAEIQKTPGHFPQINSDPKLDGLFSRLFDPKKESPKGYTPALLLEYAVCFCEVLVTRLIG